MLALSRTSTILSLAEDNQRATSTAISTSTALLHLQLEIVEDLCRRSFSSSSVVRGYANIAQRSSPTRRQAKYQESNNSSFVTFPLEFSEHLTTEKAISVSMAWPRQLGERRVVVAFEESGPDKTFSLFTVSADCEADNDWKSTLGSTRFTMNSRHSRGYL